ncbi:hypothetical protein HZC34_02665 [Candidatus Saganbacteria bacterium]|nr:hypothetical protein [Candidatus Saganbacteria bacterium]
MAGIIRLLPNASRPLPRFRYNIGLNDGERKDVLALPELKRYLGKMHDLESSLWAKILQCNDSQCLQPQSAPQNAFA